MMVSADSVAAAATTEGGIINCTRCNTGLQSDYSCFSDVPIRRALLQLFTASWETGTAAIIEIIVIV